MLRSHGCPRCAHAVKGQARRKTEEQFIEELAGLNHGIRLVAIYDAYEGDGIEAMQDIWLTQENLGTKHGRQELFETLQRLLDEAGLDHQLTEEELGAILDTALMGRRPVTDEQYRATVAEKRPDVEVLGTFTGPKSPMSFRCKVCGHEWEAQANMPLRGYGCRKCASKARC